MADYTLCISNECRAAKDCARNKQCPLAMKWDEHRQSFAVWHPSAGYACPGFLDTREATRP